MRSTPRKTGRQAKPAKASLMNTVYLKRCEEYDRDAILGIVREGMKALAYVPSGNVFVKPNCVFASTGGKFGTNAHTNPDFLGATTLALGNADKVKRVDVGENTGMRIPTRMFYKQAGYYKLMDDIQKQSRAKVDLFCIDEERRDRVFVGGVVHNTVRLSRRMARADSKVYVPKLKCHNVVNVTGAVKLNIGVLSDDERAIRHDFMLIDKIVDLLKAGYPDFIVMDAIDVGVANEIIPTVRKLGLVIMGRNPMAVDIVASRLLGYEIGDVPYLKRAVERGYTPGSLKEITLAGDIRSVRELDAQAKRIQPYDEEYYRWQDIPREFKRLNTPLRFYQGYSRFDEKKTCDYGCLMGLKLFMSVFDMYGGAEAFKNAKPAVLVMGRVEEEIDAKGNDVYLIGSCTDARVVNARKIVRLDKCPATTGDMNLGIGNSLGMQSPFLEPSYLLPFVGNLLIASMKKHISGRYLQDMGNFIKRDLEKRI